MCHEDGAASEMREAEDGVPDFVLAHSRDGLLLVYAWVCFMVLDAFVDL